MGFIQLLTGAKTLEAIWRHSTIAEFFLSTCWAVHIDAAIPGLFKYTRNSRSFHNFNHPSLP